MRFSMISMAAFAAATASPAFAQDTAPPPPVTISGSVAVVSDYKFRGISQTDGNFAVQGGITISHSSGFYIGTWGSSVDDYVTAHGTAHQELDLIGGYKITTNGTTFDIGAVYYVYPGTRLANDPTSSDFIEPYLSVSHVLGPVTGKVTVNYAPKQKALALNQTGPKNDNVYLAGDLSASIPNTGISVSGHLGHTWGPSWLSIGKEYTDWNVGASYAYKSLTFGIQYVDTDGDFITPTGKNASKGGVLGSVSVSF